MKRYIIAIFLTFICIPLNASSYFLYLVHDDDGALSYRVIETESFDECERMTKTFKHGPNSGGDMQTYFAVFCGKPMKQKIDFFRRYGGKNKIIREYEEGYRGG